MKSMQPGRVSGAVVAPTSKSMLQRAIAIACLARGPSTIRNPYFCADSAAAIVIAQQLGAVVRQGTNEIVITPGVVSSNNIELDCAESGLALRMFSAVAALYESNIIMIGHGSLARRPVGMIEQPLMSLGVQVISNDGGLPLRIHGPMRGGKVCIDGSISSQFLTGLLIALPHCVEDSEVSVTNLKSRPYIEMTLGLLRRCGLQIEVGPNLEHFYIPGSQELVGFDYVVEGDWSGAACLLVAGAIAGDVTVSGLDINSCQADRAIIDVLRRAQAQVCCVGNTIRVSDPRPDRELSAFEFDATDSPDLIPALVALASVCSGRSEVIGAHRLIHKESNRASALVREFSKLGVDIVAEGDLMTIVGNPDGVLGPIVVDSHNDHRIAMALATIALRARSEVSIRDEGCIDKSFPDFYKVIESLLI